MINLGDAILSCQSNTHYNIFYLKKYDKVGWTPMLLKQCKYKDMYGFIYVYFKVAKRSGE